MPTPLAPHSGRRLPWRRAGAVLALLARARLARWQMDRASGRLARHGRAADGDALTSSARRWLDAQARLAALFGVPEPSSVAEVRAIVEGPPAADVSHAVPVSR